MLKSALVLLDDESRSSLDPAGVSRVRGLFGLGSLHSTTWRLRLVSALLILVVVVLEAALAHAASKGLVVD